MSSLSKRSGRAIFGLGLAALVSPLLCAGRADATSFNGWNAHWNSVAELQTQIAYQHAVFELPLKRLASRQGTCNNSDSPDCYKYVRVRTRTYAKPFAYRRVKYVVKPTAGGIGDHIADVPGARKLTFGSIFTPTSGEFRSGFGGLRGGEGGGDFHFGFGAN